MINKTQKCLCSPPRREGLMMRSFLPLNAFLFLFAASLSSVERLCHVKQKLWRVCLASRGKQLNKEIITETDNNTHLHFIVFTFFQSIYITIPKLSRADFHICNSLCIQRSSSIPCSSKTQVSGRFCTNLSRFIPLGWAKNTSRESWNHLWIQYNHESHQYCKLFKKDCTSLQYLQYSVFTGSR